jgi:hypothetical protein
METIAPVSDNVTALPGLSDEELVERVKHLAACERRASVALIRSLAEFDARRLYLREGCSSLFTYCTHVLHLSEGSAYNRIETARAARRYPTVLDALERGDLTLTAVRLLAPHLTPANHGQVLAAARHRSKLGIQELIASLNPRPPAAPIIRRVPAQPSRGNAIAAFAAAPELETSLAMNAPVNSPSSSAGQDASTTPVPQFHAAVVTPLAPERYKLQVTLARETHEKTAARAGAFPTHVGGWRRRRGPRSRIDAADRPSRAAQVRRRGVTAAELRREDCIGTTHTGGRSARRVAARGGFRLDGLSFGEFYLVTFPPLRSPVHRIAWMGRQGDSLQRCRRHRQGSRFPARRLRARDRGGQTPRSVDRWEYLPADLEPSIAISGRSRALSEPGEPPSRYDATAPWRSNSTG